MRLAALDLGSNTVGYLVGEVEGEGPGSFALRERDSRFVRLAEGLARTGEVSPVALERAAEWVTEIRRRLDEQQVELRRAVGTEVLRRASNRDAVVARLSDCLGTVVEVISGDEEGRLTYAGVRGGYPEGPLAVIDIGGGSTEIVLGDAAGAVQCLSLAVGAVTLTDAYGERQDALRQAVEERLAGFEPTVALAPELTVLGGTGANVAMMDRGCKELEEAAIEGHVLERSRLAELASAAARLTPQQRVAQLGVPPRRADILVAGLVLLETVLRRLSIRRLRVSRFCLRHGVLFGLREAGQNRRLSADPPRSP